MDQQQQIDALNTQVAALTKSAQAAGQDVPSFGPPPPSGGGSSMTPGTPVTPSGATLPWNAQAGEASRFTFQGDTDYVLQPPPGFSGHRELSLSQTPPQYESIEVWLDNDASPAYTFTGSGSPVIYFVDGVARVLKLRPKVPVQFGYKGAGMVQFVGGAVQT